mmetsp:Transcript_469/g.1393  ORF Transcript_469/g.1393 Transcript_469/m.1393 type:complete len:148 (-) Transcript_469:115-558(-)
MSAPQLSGSITFIYAADFDAACEFYGTALGLPAAGAMGDNVKIFALPGAYLGIVRQGVSAAASPPMCAKDAGRDTVIVGLLCADAEAVDALAAKLDPACIEAAPARNDTFGIYNMMARDPNGYLVEIQAFLDPSFLPPVAKLTTSAL